MSIDSLLKISVHLLNCRQNSSGSQMVGIKKSRYELSGFPDHRINLAVRDVKLGKADPDQKGVNLVILQVRLQVKAIFKYGIHTCIQSNGPDSNFPGGKIQAGFFEKGSHHFMVLLNDVFLYKPGLECGKINVFFRLVVHEHNGLQSDGNGKLQKRIVKAGSNLLARPVDLFQDLLVYGQQDFLFVSEKIVQAPCGNSGLS